MKIYAVGLGPGGGDQITPRAAAAIDKSGAVVGYDYYMKLIKDRLDGKIVYSSGMMKERERCQKAVEYALSGIITAVVSSGDAGIYGMAGIIHELCADYPQIDIEVIPGITAACSGAALAGAPLGHDFAVISLSDLMTPWEIIKKRIRCAAEADFVICIYNPGSKKRTEHLKRACEYIMEYRSGDTPCAYMENIGRSGESCTVCTLSELSGISANMFTTVIVGSSTTKVINGRLVTPRGYNIEGNSPI